MRCKIFAVLFLLIGFPTFADTQQIDIAPDANVLCNAALLGTTSGTVRLRANFVPEDIDLKWYDGNNQVNVANASNTCTYDTAINLPTNPTREGYEFKGWKILTYDFSTFDTTINGRHRYGHCVDTSNDSEVCLYDGRDITCDDNFADLSRYQWKTSFNYGTIYGDSMCSSIPGTYARSGTPINDDGKYCWCRATGYKNNDNILYSPNSILSWVFVADSTSEHNCAYNCASYCASDLRFYTGFRQALFGQSGS